MAAFTEAEKQVLGALAKGADDHEISTILVVPESTLRRHYEHLAEKILARRDGLPGAPPPG